MCCESANGRSYANLALLPRGVSTITCMSPSSVKGGKLMKFAMAKVPGRWGVRRSAESAELTPQDNR
jgi:hypothetical protein